MTLTEYKIGMELTDDVEAARGYIDYLPEGKDKKKAEQIIAEYEKTKPFTVDDKLIFSKNGINTEVNFRGYDKDGNAVIVSKSGQLAVDKKYLHR